MYLIQEIHLEYSIYMWRKSTNNRVALNKLVCTHRLRNGSHAWLRVYSSVFHHSKLRMNIINATISVMKETFNMTAPCK